MSVSARPIPREPQLDFRTLYDRFDESVTIIDCGQMCAPHNPSGKPFCCDICHAVPAAYRQEWSFLEHQTDLWQPYTGAECPSEPAEIEALWSDTPENMTLLACLGPESCQRPFRAISCRQFPFIPYISSQDDFLGLAHEWAFEDTCWVISHLSEVTSAFRESFVRFFEALFSCWPAERIGYARLSEELRDRFIEQRRRITLLHRKGGYFRISPASERMRQVRAVQLPKFGPYKIK